MVIIKLKTLVICALLVSLNLVLDTMTIQVNATLHISFKFLTIALAGAFYGWQIGAIVGGATDIIGFFAYPKGPFMWGFTISAILTGMIYGLILHKKRSFVRCALAQITVCVVINIVLNTIWLIMLYGNTPAEIITLQRIIKNIILLPLEIIMLYGVLQVCKRVKI
ncbi:MAG: folate family ECF transporter S component [Clostridiales bacterium]|nr:folate family ECF transporter S component [Clostridiales bacterium]